jgi:hypothetical protein
MVEEAVPKMVNVSVHNRTKSPTVLYTGQARRHSVSILPGRRVNTQMSDVYYRSYADRNATGIVVTEAKAAAQRATSFPPPKEPHGGDDPSPHVDTIEAVLADVENEVINYAQLRSRAKALLGNDFPLGTSPKRDEIVELLQAKLRKEHGSDPDAG